MLAKQNRDAPLKGYQRWWIYVIIYVGLSIASVLLAHVGRSFICEAFVVPARSMSPTIHHGDRIIVDKLWANSNTMQRGDVVVFRSEGPDSPFFVQRVAGLPGETIEIVNECVLINGSPIDDSNAVFDGSLPEYTWREIANYGPLLIPSDCFFVLGDNRRFSRDSRLLGPIPLSDYHATVRMIYWSQERTFLDPLNSSNYTLGPMRWDRMGARLD